MDSLYEALARSRNICIGLKNAPKPPVVPKIFHATQCLYIELREYHKLEVNLPANGSAKDKLRTLK
jgi:hypothetical protein